MAGVKAVTILVGLLLLAGVSLVTQRLELLDGLISADLLGSLFLPYSPLQGESAPGPSFFEGVIRRWWVKEKA